jgi:hypothetical protein
LGSVHFFPTTWRPSKISRNERTHGSNRLNAGNGTEDLTDQQLAYARHSLALLSAVRAEPAGSDAHLYLAGPFVKGPCSTPSTHLLRPRRRKSLSTPEANPTHPVKRVGGRGDPLETHGQVATWPGDSAAEAQARQAPGLVKRTSAVESRGHMASWPTDKMTAALPPARPLFGRGRQALCPLGP